MTWLDRASQILDFTLFQLGGNPITVLHVVMSAVALVITHFLARSVRKVLHRYLLKELDDAPRYVIVRFTQYLVWIVGIAIALELLNVDLTALTVVAGAVGIVCRFRSAKRRQQLGLGYRAVIRTTGTLPRSRHGGEYRRTSREHQLSRHYHSDQ